MDKIGPCKTCGAEEYKLTVTRVDEITVDADGDVADKGGLDSFSDLSCTSCGAVAIKTGELTDDQSRAVFWEIERHVLEG